MTADPALPGMPEPLPTEELPRDVDPRLGKDAAATARRRIQFDLNAAGAGGVHPATHLPFHEAAAPAVVFSAEDNELSGLRCGDCARRYLKHAAGFKGWKCGTPAGNLTKDGPDLRLWWPACSAFRSRESPPPAPSVEDDPPHG